MQYYADYHVHSNFSTDGQSSMEDMTNRAIELGLKEIVFTDHLDLDHPDGDFIVDIKTYIPYIYKLKKMYQDKINVKLGIEIGVQNHLYNELDNIINNNDFDFVIASSHMVNGIDPYFNTFFDGLTQYEGYLKYFESILENVTNFNNYSVYGHLDYVIRYGNFSDRTYLYSDYKDVYDSLLKTIISNGRGIEINTSGFRYDLNSPHPTLAVIKHYKELGGEIITIGSDAHKPCDICADFDNAYDILNQLGFKYITTFDNMKPNFIPINL